MVQFVLQLNQCYYKRDQLKLSFVKVRLVIRVGMFTFWCIFTEHIKFLKFLDFSWSSQFMLKSPTIIHCLDQGPPNFSARGPHWFKNNYVEGHLTLPLNDTWIQNSIAVLHTSPKCLTDSPICLQTSIATLQTSPYHFKHSTEWIK